jgi:hypothetical protein
MKIHQQSKMNALLVAVHARLSQVKLTAKSSSTSHTPGLIDQHYYSIDDKLTILSPKDIWCPWKSFKRPWEKIGNKYDRKTEPLMPWKPVCDLDIQSPQLHKAWQKSGWILWEMTRKLNVMLLTLNGIQRSCHGQPFDRVFPTSPTEAPKNSIQCIILDQSEPCIEDEQHHSNTNQVATRIRFSNGQQILLVSEDAVNKFFNGVLIKQGQLLVDSKPIWSKLCHNDARK